MRKTLFFIALLLPALFVACESDSVSPDKVDVSGIYMVNYGNYNGVKGSITNINIETKESTDGAFESVNGRKMKGNPQYAAQYGNKIYFMGNSTDEVFFVDANTLKQSKDGITIDIEKPRHFAGDGNYIYVSCWGGDIWKDSSTSYIAKVDTAQNKVVKKIACPGGSEGLAIANGKLYIAYGYEKKIGIMNLSTEEITYIENQKAMSSYFLKDKEDNLYLAQVSTYSAPSEMTGLAYINTKTDKIDNFFPIVLNHNDGNMLSANSDFSKIYVLGVAYNASFQMVGGVQVFDVAKGKFESSALIEDVTGLKSVTVNPETNEVYVSTSPTAASAGTLTIYNDKGTETNSLNIGVTPAWTLFIE